MIKAQTENARRSVSNGLLDATHTDKSFVSKFGVMFALLRIARDRADAEAARREDEERSKEEAQQGEI